MYNIFIVYHKCNIIVVSSIGLYVSIPVMIYCSTVNFNKHAICTYNSLKITLYFQHLVCSRPKVLLIEVEY